MAQKSIKDHMYERNNLQFNTGGNPPSEKPKQMPEDEAKARHKEFKEKFGYDYSKPEPVVKKSAPKVFPSKEAKEEYFKKGK
jgi:hypothetical protein